MCIYRELSAIFLTCYILGCQVHTAAGADEVLMMCHLANRSILEVAWRVYYAFIHKVSNHQKEESQVTHKTLVPTS